MSANVRPNGKELRPLLIFPYDGNGIEAVDCLGDIYRLVGFVDDTPEKQGTGMGGHPILSRAAFGELSDSAVLAVPGSPKTYRTRRAIIEGLEVSEDRFACVIHPTSAIPSRVVSSYSP